MNSIVLKPMPVCGFQQKPTASHTALMGIAIICALVLALSACGAGSSGEENGIDPGLVQVPIAYIKRPVAVDDMGVELQADLRRPPLFSAGGDVYLQSSTAVNASKTNITSSVTLGQGDVRGLNSSYDGLKLIFSLRPFDSNPLDDVVPGLAPGWCPLPGR